MSSVRKCWHSQALPASCRPRNGLGTQVSDSLRLRVSGEQPSQEQQAATESTSDADYEGNGMATGGSSVPRAEASRDELGNSRGKRMAMKFVNKIASKEKYTQVAAFLHRPD